MPTQTITYWDDANNDGIVFPYTRIDVEQDPIFASDGIQLEATRYSFTIRGVITGGDLADFQYKVCRMKQFLVVRGLHFKVTWLEDSGSGPTTLYDIDGFTDDVSWGPVPGKLSLTRFGGGRAALYEFTLVATRKQCFVQCSSQNPTQAPVSRILSVTKRLDAAIDVNGLTTKTISGRLVISALAIIQDGHTANDYRYYVEPVIPSSFKVLSRHYAQSENGREMAYAIVMQEMNFTLPAPLTNGDASFTVRLQDNGLLAHFSLSGFFEAPYTVSKDLIYARIVELVDSKLGAFIASSNPVFFESQEITEANMYEKNHIDFSFGGTFVAGTGTAGYDANFYAALLTTTLSNPPNSNGQPNVAWPYGGDSNGDSDDGGDVPFTGFNACNADNPQATATAGNGPIPGADPGFDGDRDDAADTNIFGDRSGITTDHKIAPYIAFHEEVHYSLDNGVEVFYPKQAGLDPVVQQSRQPSMTIIQAGYMVRYAHNVEAVTLGVPDPIGDTTNRVILSAEIPASTPEPMGDGSFSRWTTHWRYTMRAIKAYTSSDSPSGSALGIDYPKDPRRVSSGVNPVQRTTNVLLVDPTVI